MSMILGFRQRVMDFLKENVEELNEIDWFDGLFDEEDVKDWSLKTPSAFVSVMRAPGKHHTTGELNIDLRVTIAVIVADDMSPRDADPKCWEVIEKIAILANFQKFNDPNAGPACEVKFERLRDPELRRDGVAIGIVEWTNSLTIGKNMSVQREFYPGIDRLPSLTNVESDVRSPLSDRFETVQIDLKEE